MSPLKNHALNGTISMSLLLALVLMVLFVVALGSVVLISVDRAASLADDRTLDLALGRK
jgi:hypothetical protein